MNIRILFLILLFSQITAASVRINVAALPLKNESGNEMFDWISYSLPEVLYRKAQLIEGLKIWDPVFLIQTDSNSTQLINDSLFSVHRNRWQWDAAISGKYTVINDTVWIRLQVIWYTGKDEMIKMEIKGESALQNMQLLFSNLSLKVFSLIQFPLSTTDSICINHVLNVPSICFQTYFSGYSSEVQGDYSGAITAYNRAIEIDPHFETGICRLAKLYANSGNYERAMGLFEQIGGSISDPLVVADVANFFIEAKPISDASGYVDSKKKYLEMSATGLKAIGSLFIAMGEYQRALSFLTKAVAAGPGDLEVEFTLGMAYLSTGDNSMAIDIFNRLIRFRPNYLRFYSSLGAAHRNAGRLMESSMVLQTALKMDPHNSTILIDLAQTYSQLLWYQKAAQLLLQAHEYSPTNFDVIVNLGVVYWHLGNKVEAEKWLSCASENQSTRQSSLVNFGNLSFTDGNVKKAIKLYRKALKSGKNNETLFFNIANAYLVSKKYRKAIFYFDELLRLSPNRIDVLLKLGEISEKQKAFEKAELYLQKALDIAPYNKSVINSLVHILEAQEKFQSAIKPVEMYLENFPSSKEYLLLLAGLYRKMEWLEVAIMKYQFVMRDYPDLAAGYLGAGECLYDLSKIKRNINCEDAIYILRKAAELDSLKPEANLLIGNIYLECKGYRELAVDHWKKALKYTINARERKLIMSKIKNAGQ
jgi:tetratricopeptide (TPR) repeat protein